MKKAPFITFEGIDGVGSSTQTRKTFEYLVAQGYEVVLTKEPGGTALGESLRTLLLSDEERNSLAELFTFEAARTQLIFKVIRPALEEGKIVLADRYTDSSLAYQGYGRGIPLSIIHQLNEIATGKLEPDLTLLYDLDQKRTRPQVQAYFEKLGSGFQERVRDGYLRMADMSPTRIKLIERVEAENPEESIRRTFEERTLPLVLEKLREMGFGQFTK